MSSDKLSKHLKAMRHTAAHVLAVASRNLRPETRLGIGPATEDGFFHDIDVDANFTEADLSALQAEMEKIKQMNLPIEQREYTKDEARKIFADDPYKLELIEEIEGDSVGVSDMGNGYFLTLCEGGHLESTGQLGAFKLTKLSGVYWKGEEDRPQLQRIFGLCFANEKEMRIHEKMLEEAKKRDHKVLGKKLDLFTFSSLVGPGLPLFTPRGSVIREELEKFINELHEEQEYQRVIIPHLARPELYKTSGHWDKFKEDLFHVRGKSNEDFVMKPMNCPHHTQIYASRMRSYKDLPIRYAENTAVYRDEQSGELQGLTRVRSITQDDGHVFCRPDQIRDEIDRILTMIDRFYGVFDFELTFRLSLRDADHPERYLGSNDIWENAEGTLRSLLKEKGLSFDEAAGEAAFYGPKIDFTAHDSIGRAWQLATIQLDFNMPERFSLKYTDENGEEQTPVMIHRAVTGAYERLMGILIEHYAGAFPLWLSPVQVVVLPIADDQHDYARGVLDRLKDAGLRAEIDDRSLSIGKKIREAEMMKVPVMLIMGKKEVEAETVSIRIREEGDKGAKPVAEIIEELKQRVKSKE